MSAGPAAVPAGRECPLSAYPAAVHAGRECPLSAGPAAVCREGMPTESGPCSSTTMSEKDVLGITSYRSMYDVSNFILYAYYNAYCRNVLFFFFFILGWVLKTKTYFRRNSPVFLLGKCYHFKFEGKSL